MDFRDDVQLDTSQVESGGRGRLPGGGLAVGGGAAGIIALIVALIFGINPGNITGGDPAPVGPSSNLGAQCKTGEDADQNEECRVVGVVNSIQEYWPNAVEGYQPAKTVLFSGAVNTGCGAADSSVGPFYCPNDQRVYLDLSFFDQLQSRFGAEGGPFAQAYVIGHEYGHHVQNLTGVLGQSQSDRQGPESGAVRVELQADCYAGAWAKNAYETGLFEKPFTQADIEQALSAAAAVGDDNIQKRAQGRVDPEGFTHGTSEQRVKWFSTGYETGDPRRCDTFSGGI
ncbi:neutral zinc metallopeptidase [Planobispora longispora]|uniref:Membrane protein n=1 Tax=Planobispora longispora TaxID=28887 RepID=A0A8J3RFM7_9ACTN|nr:neutral zinc metallopeptidase [Planobispora longispora]BFE84901.1 neutral zinc metallopeptidase [Planobispora longispora]GIH75371.1 membrane protein [Planobispora longispora]